MTIDISKFWLGINFIIVAGICCITAMSTNYWGDYNTKIVRMIADGVNPLEAVCAMQNDYGKSPTCIVLAAK